MKISMKKLLSVLLAMVLALTMLVGAVAETVDVTGTWSTTLMGMNVTFVINADGTYTLDIAGLESVDGTWEYQDDGNLLLDKGTDEEAVAVVGDETLSVTESGMVMDFVRGEAGLAETTDFTMRADATLEELQGEWSMTSIVMMGFEMSAELADTTAAVGVQDSNVVFHDLMGDTSLEGVLVPLEFSEGALRMELQDETSTQVWTIGLLADGRLNFTMNVDGLEIAMLMEKVVEVAE